MSASISTAGFCSSERTLPPTEAFSVLSWHEGEGREGPGGPGAPHRAYGVHPRPPWPQIHLPPPSKMPLYVHTEPCCFRGEPGRPWPAPVGTDGPEKLPASASRMGNPPRSQGVGQSFLPTQRFRKPFESGEPASPTSLSLPLSVSSRLL